MRKQTSSWIRVCSAFIACVFLQYSVAPRQAFAWDEGTHQKLTDWAYQVIRLTEYELDTNPAKPPLTTHSGVTGSMTSPPSTCTTSTCLTQWSAFLDKVATARGDLAKLTFGPAEKGKDQHGGNITCSPNVTGRAAGDYDRVVQGAPPGCGEAQDYEAGGIFDDPALTARPNGLLGNTLGYVASAADYRTDDWDPQLDPTALVVSFVSLVLTLGTDTNALDPLVDVVNTGRQVAATVLGLVLAIVFFIFTLGLVDSEDVIDAAFDVAHFIANFDIELFSIIPLIADLPELFAGGEDEFTGLGHFINMQPQVTTFPWGSKWPSNDYDDHQGICHDEAMFNAVPGSPIPRLFQDSLDHFLVDTSGMGVVINPFDSFGVDHYQNGSDERGFFSNGNFVSDETYWQQTELHAIQFTPVEKLGDHGWQSFKSDSCKNAESLMWPLHALGDAAVPMHVIGTTGQGHRPFESSLRRLGNQWETVRHLHPKEFVGGATAPEYAPGDPQQVTDFQAQKDQARRILDEAFEWSQVIQQQAPGDIDVQALVTQVAQRTLNMLHASATAKVTCQRNACRVVTFQEPAEQCGEQECPMRAEIHCDAAECTGFLNDPRNPSGVTSDPTDNNEHCWYYGSNPNGLDKCSITTRVAKLLSGESYAGVPYPAILAPGLSDEWSSSEGSAMSYYAPYFNEHRRFAEHAAAATLAFMTHAADFVGTPSVTACSCASGRTLCGSGVAAFCQDLSQDRNNCGACGNTCAPLERCEAGVCTTPCQAPWTLCSGECVDTRYDFDHCGACNQPCPTTTNYCSNGGCGELL